MRTQRFTEMLAIRLTKEEMRKLKQVTEVISKEEEFQFTVSETVREIILDTWEALCGSNTKKL